MIDQYKLISGVVASQVVGIVFLVAGISKVGSTKSTREAVQAYGLLTPLGVTLVAAWLPVVELLLSILLMTNVARAIAHHASISLIACFSLAQLSVLLRRKSIYCGCYGSLLPQKIGWMSLAFNICLFVIAFVANAYSRDEALTLFQDELTGQGFVLQVVSTPLLIRMVTTGFLAQMIIIWHALQNAVLRRNYERTLEEIAEALSVSTRSPLPI